MNTKVKMLMVFFASAVLLLAMGMVFYFTPDVWSHRQNANDALAPSAAVHAQNQINPGLPVRVSIPSIQVDAAIQYVALAPDGSMGVSKGPYDVAWFELGPRPGQRGSAVIAGHYGSWISGANSVFDNLKNLKKGDKVHVKDDQGKLISFAVTGSRVYDPKESAPDVFAKEDGVYLNLVTCSGDWVAAEKTYTKRLVVFTSLVP